MKLIERTAYLEEMKDLLQTPDIKVITGVRRCGKSCLMETIAGELTETGIASENIIYLTCCSSKRLSAIPSQSKVCFFLPIHSLSEKKK